MSVLPEHHQNNLCSNIIIDPAASFWPCLCVSLVRWISSGFCLFHFRETENKTSTTKPRSQHNCWLTTLHVWPWLGENQEVKKKNGIIRDRAACGHVCMVVTDSYTVTELYGLKKHPTQFLVDCLILSNKYLTLYFQQGHPELMAQHCGVEPCWRTSRGDELAVASLVNVLQLGRRTQQWLCECVGEKGCKS